MARKDRLLRDAERGRFLFTLDTEEAFEGVLVDWDEAHFVIDNAFSVAPTGDRLAIDGPFWLPRPRVKYHQAVTT